MDQRKYLIFLIIIFYSQISLSSAWLPPLGGYKYSTTTLNIDQSSNYLKNHRILVFNYIEQKISVLLVKKSLIQCSTKLKNKQYLQKILDQKILKLKKALVELASFSEYKTISTEFEQRISKNSSLGIMILKIHNSFTDSLYISTKSTFEDQLINIFYKYKVFQNNTHIFTISPQIFIKNNYLFGDEYNFELSFLQATTNKKELFEIFTESSLNLGICYPKPRANMIYCSCTATEGIKFNNGLMINSYTQYKYNKSASTLYQKTLYEQLSISKLFNYKNSNLKELMLSIGYFWKYSLIKKNYKISGFIFTAILVL